MRQCDALNAIAGLTRAARARRAVLVSVALLLASAVPGAVTLTQTATATATIDALAKLTITSPSVSFEDADPDTVPNLPQREPALTIDAKMRTTAGSIVSLSVTASDNLRSGLDVIPVSQLRWTATGPGFVNGSASLSAPQRLGTWTGSGYWRGTQSYSLVNSWTYATGTYSTTLTYTLSDP